MEIVVSEIFFSCIEGTILLLLYTLINDTKEFVRENKLKSFIFIFMYTFLSSWPATLIPPGMHTIFILIFAAILLSFITQTHLFASVISVALSTIFFFATEMISAIIPMLIFKIDLQAIIDIGYYRLLFGSVIKLVQFVLTIILIKSKFKLKKLSEFKKPNSLYSLFVLQSLMVSIIFFSLGVAPDDKQNTFTYNIFLAVIYIFFLILILLDFKERWRLQAIQYKFQAQEEYISNMENIISIIRKEKHDFSNHLNTILAICVLNKPKAIQKIENYVRKISDNIKTSYHFFNTGNDFVDGLLAVKSNVAFEHGIHLEVDFEVSLDKLDINDCDLTSIISNIVDNAFDAILSTDQYENKVVSLVTYEEDSNYYLSISNNGPIIHEKGIQRIFDNGYTTKSSSTIDRGFGLYIVQQLVKRNNGIISVTSTDEETEFLIKFEERGENIGKSCKQDHRINMSKQSQFNNTTG